MLSQPLNSNFYKENSILDIAMIVKWNKSKRKYNFETLPKTALISMNKYVLDRNARLFSKKIKGIMGQNFILNKNLLFCSGFGNGAPAIIGFMEELRELGVENFVFLGLAGTFGPNCKEGDVYLIKNTYSTVGCTSLYSPNSNFEPNKNDWYKDLKTKLDLPETNCWSTDAPFRETNSLLTHFETMKVTHVDMECASIYAFAEFYKLNSLCIVVTADNLSDATWKPPQNMDLLHSNLNNTAKTLITLIND